jgi:hypothetical protein
MNLKRKNPELLDGGVRTDDVEETRVVGYEA